jgi:hypothetical protein
MLRLARSGYSKPVLETADIALPDRNRARYRAHDRDHCAIFCMTVQCPAVPVVADLTVGRHRSLTPRT